MTATIRLVIAGSRTVSPTIADIDTALVPFLSSIGLALCADSTYRDAISEVICGDANGADRAGDEWAKARGVAVHHEPILTTDIEQHGKYAGPRMRNRRMAERGTHALIFWDGISGGSADMCMRMVARGKPVVVVPFKPRPTRKWGAK